MLLFRGVPCGHPRPNAAGPPGLRGGHHNEDIEYRSADTPAARYTRVEGRIANERTMRLHEQWRRDRKLREAKRLLEAQQPSE